MDPYHQLSLLLFSIGHSLSAIFKFYRTEKTDLSQVFVCSQKIFEQINHDMRLAS